MPLPSKDTVVPTIYELLDAIEKNNYPQAYGELFKVDETNHNRQLSACAFGQGLLNLGLVTKEELKDSATAWLYHSEWGQWLLNSSLHHFYASVFHYNDRERMTPQEIARTLRNWNEDAEETT